MTTEEIKSSLGYKILDLLKERQFENQDWVSLDEVRDLIKDHSPEIEEFHFADNYDGPSDGDAWAGGFADNH